MPTAKAMMVAITPSILSSLFFLLGLMFPFASVSTQQFSAQQVRTGWPKWLSDSRHQRRHANGRPHAGCVKFGRKIGGA
jgi:hypothetical protein